MADSDLRAFTQDLSSMYDKTVKEHRRLRDLLSRDIQALQAEPDFQASDFQKSLSSLSTQIENASAFQQKLDILFQSYEASLKRLASNLSLVDDEKASVISQLQNYILSVHEQLNLIDRSSSIPLHGQTVHMLEIETASWEDSRNLYESRLERFVSSIVEKGIALLEENQSFHDMIAKEITTSNLYDTIIGTDSIHIKILKIEPQRQMLISWEESQRNSGGEGFLTSFTILSCLLDYMRYDNTDTFRERREGKVLLMDNPFAQTTAPHLLLPMLNLAKRTNTQLICMTALTQESIHNCFDNIYVLNLIPSSLSGMKYLKGRQVGGKDENVLSFSHMDVHNEGEQLTMLF